MMKKCSQPREIGWEFFVLHVLQVSIIDSIPVSELR